MKKLKYFLLSVKNFLSTIEFIVILVISSLLSLASRFITTEDVYVVAITVSGILLGVTLTSIALIISILAKYEFIWLVTVGNFFDKIYTKTVKLIRDDFIYMMISFIFIFIVYIFHSTFFPIILFRSSYFTHETTWLFIIFFFFGVSLSAFKDITLSCFQIIELYAEEAKKKVEKEVSPNNP